MSRSLPKQATWLSRLSLRWTSRIKCKKIFLNWIHGGDVALSAILVTDIILSVKHAPLDLSTGFAAEFIHKSYGKITGELRAITPATRSIESIRLRASSKIRSNYNRAVVSQTEADVKSRRPSQVAVHRPTNGLDFLCGDISKSA